MLDDSLKENNTKEKENKVVKNKNEDKKNENINLTKVKVEREEDFIQDVGIGECKRTNFF